MSYCKHNFWLAYSRGNSVLVIQNLHAWPRRLLNLVEGQRLISGDQTEPGVHLKSTCLDMLLVSTSVQWSPWCFVLEHCRQVCVAIFELAPFVSLLDTEVLCLWNRRFTWHISCPLFQFKLFFQTRLSSFSFKRNANEANIFCGCCLGLWKTASSWREMSSDIVCCLSVFLDTAIFRRPPSASLWKRISHLLSWTVPYVHFKPMQLSQVWF